MKTKLLLGAALTWIVFAAQAQTFNKANLIEPMDITNAFRCVTADNAGFIYYGNTSGKLGKMDSTGTEVFMKTYPTIGILANLTFTDIALDASGDIIACGTFKQGFINGTDTVKTRGPVGNSATSDGFVGKFSKTTGDIIWFKPLGGNNNDNAMGLLIDNAGGIFVTGSLNAGSGLQVTFDTISRSSLQNEMYLVKFNNDGSAAWLQKSNYVSNGYGYTCTGNQISTDAAGNLYVAGNWDGKGSIGSITKDLYQHSYVMKFTHEGVLTWATVFETGGGGSMKAMAADGDGNTYLSGFCGNFGGSTAGMTMPGGKSYFVKVNADGSFGWKKILYINAVTPAYVVKCNSLNDIYFSGNFGSSITFQGVGDSVTLTPGTASTSIFLVKYKADGSITWAMSSKPVTFSSMCTPLDIHIMKGGQAYLMCTVTGNTKFNTLLIPGSGYLNPVVLFEAGGKTDPGTGIQAVETGESTRLYPNPASSVLHIENYTGQVTLFNISGQAVKETYVERETAISIGDMPAGVYFVRCGGFVKKLVIE